MSPGENASGCTQVLDASMQSFFDYKEPKNRERVRFQQEKVSSLKSVVTEMTAQKRADSKLYSRH
jgi:hypothetical protein